MVKEFGVRRYHRKVIRSRRHLGILRCVNKSTVLRISNEFLTRMPYSKRMELSIINSRQHQFAPKLPIISKQCNDYRKAIAALIMRRTVGNVVQSIPFVDANRDDRVELHLSDSCIPITLPSLIEKSPRLSYLLGEFFFFLNPRKTQECKNTEKQNESDTRKYI